MGLPQPKLEEAQTEPHSVLEDLQWLASKSVGNSLQPRVEVVTAFVMQALRIDEERANKRREGFLRVNALGRSTKTANAQAMREDWTSHLIEFVVDKYQIGKHPSRHDLLNEIRGYSLTRRYKGLNGQQVKLTTIKKWLTKEFEQDIRNRALQKLSS